MLYTHRNDYRFIMDIRSLPAELLRSALPWKRNRLPAYAFKTAASVAARTCGTRLHGRKRTSRRQFRSHRQYQGTSPMPPLARLHSSINGSKKRDGPATWFRPQTPLRRRKTRRRALCKLGRRRWLQQPLRTCARDHARLA